MSHDVRNALSCVSDVTPTSVRCIMSRRCRAQGQLRAKHGRNRFPVSGRLHTLSPPITPEISRTTNIRTGEIRTVLKFGIRLLIQPYVWIKHEIQESEKGETSESNNDHSMNIGTFFCEGIQRGRARKTEQKQRHFRTHCRRKRCRSWRYHRSLHDLQISSCELTCRQ